jgi:CRP-like cAMP-binding protein
VKYGRGETIFTQGEPCNYVLYIQSGGMKLSVLSKTGKEAVVPMLGPGDFFGEGCLVGQAVRMGSATAITPSTMLRVPKRQKVELLHVERCPARLRARSNPAQERQLADQRNVSVTK